MQKKIDRLRAEHARIGEAVRAMLPRVARRPVSRFALEETLQMLDTVLAVHEREEEQLFKGAAEDSPLLAEVREAHDRIEGDRGLLRNGLANWDLPGGTGALAAVDPEALAVRAEEVLQAVLDQFEHEERLVDELSQAVTEAATGEPKAKAKTPKAAGAQA